MEVLELIGTIGIKSKLNPAYLFSNRCILWSRHFVLMMSVVVLAGFG
jgi:hypothetical protein